MSPQPPTIVPAEAPLSSVWFPHKIYVEASFSPVLERVAMEGRTELLASPPCHRCLVIVVIIIVNVLGIGWLVGWLLRCAWLADWLAVVLNLAG